MDKPDVPKELQEFIEELNKNWITEVGYKLIPFYDDDEYGAEWRLKLVNLTETMVFMTHIPVDYKVPGFFYRKIVSGYVEGRGDGIVTGQANAIEYIVKKYAQEVIGVSGIRNKHDLSEPIKALLGIGR